MFIWISCGYNCLKEIDRFFDEPCGPNGLLSEQQAVKRYQNGAEDSIYAYALSLIHISLQRTYSQGISKSRYA